MSTPCEDASCPSYGQMGASCNCQADPPWTRWQGEGPPPAFWWATNPETGERTKIYRSYEDYCCD